MRTFVLVLGFLCLIPLSEGAALHQIAPTSIRPNSIHAHAAHVLMDRKKNELAMKELKLAMHNDPYNRSVAIKLARVYFSQKEYARSLDLVLPFQNLSTRKTNLLYFIARCHEEMGNFDDAYLYFKKAYRLDPTLYKASLNIARLFVKKGLYFDAATHLKTLLETNPDYTPAQQEFAMVLKVIRENRHNIFRRGNLVVTFPDYNLIRDLEEWYPFLQERIWQVKNAMGAEDFPIWMEIVDKIRTPAAPPAWYNPLEQKLYLTVDTVQRRYTSLFVHQLTYLFLHRMGLDRCPPWLKEGIALYFAQPNLLKNMSLRRLNGNWNLLQNKFFPDRRYLHFDRLSDADRENLFQAFLIAKFLIQRYGWGNLEKFVKAFGDGNRRLEEIVWDTFHIHFRQMVDDFDMYLITRYYFKS